jgi:hypothetical protein
MLFLFLNKLYTIVLAVMTNGLASPVPTFGTTLTGKQHVFYIHPKLVLLLAVAFGNITTSYLQQHS